jgi:hypothetical protein
MGHNASQKSVLRRGTVNSPAQGTALERTMTTAQTAVANAQRLAPRPFGAPPVAGKANPQTMREEIHYGVFNGSARKKSNAAVTPGNAGESGQ